MNFTQNFLNEEDSEIHLLSHPELIINQRFYGNQSLDNLIELKLKVHNVLNVSSFFRKIVQHVQPSFLPINQELLLYSPLSDYQIIEVYGCKSRFLWIYQYINRDMNG